VLYIRFYVYFYVGTLSLRVILFTCCNKASLLGLRAFHLEFSFHCHVFCLLVISFVFVEVMGKVARDSSFFILHEKC